MIWKDDGYKQHFKALVYYGKYLRSIIRNLLTCHRLIIPNWDFSIGEGADILATLNYYVIGDPFAAFSVLVPERFTGLLYSGLIILRIYCSGLSFIVLCLHFKKKNRYAILIAALSYAFCSWNYTLGIKHPYFINPMIWMPLLIVGIEKIIKKESPILLTVTVSIAAFSNFYFFFQIVFIAGAYSLIRIYADKYRKQFWEGTVCVLKIVVFSALGLSMAMVLVLPVLNVFLNDIRMENATQYKLLFSLLYYSKLPSLLLTSSVEDYAFHYLKLGYSSPVLIAVLTLFLQKKKNRTLKILLLLGLLFMVFPIPGQILNGFSYPSQRWCWSYALLCCYVLVTEWEHMWTLNAKEKKMLYLAVTSYVVICLLANQSRNTETLMGIVLLLLMLQYISNEYLQQAPILNQKQLVSISCVLLCVLNGYYWYLTSDGYGYLGVAVSNQTLYNKNEADAVTEAAAQNNDQEFSRYSGQAITRNANLGKNLSSTQLFWSLTNPYISKYRIDMEVMEPMPQLYSGYDNRTIQNILSSVKYYVSETDNTDPLPYGYTFNQRIDDGNKEYDVYTNDNQLPLGYSYSTVLSDEDWEKMNAVEKQEALLTHAYLKGYDGNISCSSVYLETKSLTYECTGSGNDISIFEDKIVTTAKNQVLTIKIEGQGNSEVYLRWQGLTYKETANYDLYFGDDTVDPANLYDQEAWNLLSAITKQQYRKEKVFFVPQSAISFQMKTDSGKKSMLYNTSENDYYLGRENFSCNLGYSEAPVTEIKITLPSPGIYSFDSIEVFEQSMGNIPDYVEQLRTDTLQNIKFCTDTVTGEFCSDEDKILVMTIPYSEEWTVYLDGQKVPSYPANGKYIGIEVPSGNHIIQMQYHTRLLQEGLWISLGGILIFIAYLLKRMV